MTNPLISIIVPVYNSEVTLGRCIDSIIKQTYSNFELILIDDSSSDNSLSICQNYSKIDNRITVKHNETNQGVTITRNTGLDIANGDYILFIDNDDYIDTNYIEVFVNELNSNTDVDLLTQNILFHEDGKEPYIVSDQLSLGGPWGKLFKKAIIDKNHIRFIPHLQYNEDNLFLLDYLEKTNQRNNIPHAGYHYIIHNGCTSKKIENNYHANSVGLILFLKRIESNSFSNTYNYEFARNRCSFMFHRYLSALFREPGSNVKERESNFLEVIKSSKCSVDYYPKQYKADKIIILLLKFRLYSLAFNFNDMLFSHRLYKQKSA